MEPKSISGINLLPQKEKEAIFRQFIPAELLEHFGIPSDFMDEQGRSLLKIDCASGSADMFLDLRHEFGASDPLLYAHLTDTSNNQIHVLLYVVNDPTSPRFDVDRMPDGTLTQFGTLCRNIPAEKAAMEAGLAPGQIRRGLRLFRHSLAEIETFVDSIGHHLFFIEPLYYHNSILFERYGFAYQQGYEQMLRIHEAFQADSETLRSLDGSSPFRQPGMQLSVRGRSWAIHDGILGFHFDSVTMYKRLGVHAEIDTFQQKKW